MHLGAHVSSSGGIHTAIDRIEAIGGESVQVFTQSPRTWRPKDDFYAKSVEALKNTVDVGCAIEADGVIFHVGSHQGAGFEAGLERVVPALAQALERCSDATWLLMENTAGAGGTIGRSVEELATILDRLDRHPRLGICLDSCHLYASGYDVTDRDAFDGLLDEVDTAIGLDRLRALHVNDSKTPVGSNRD